MSRPELPRKCPNCQSENLVDDDKDFYHCEDCGKSFRKTTYKPSKSEGKS